MNLTFESYWPLLLLLAVPLLWRARRASEIDLSPKHLRLSTWVRSAIVVLAAIALMQPALHKASTDVSVIYLLDISQSIASGAIRDGLRWIGETETHAKPQHSRFVAFGANARALETRKELENVKVRSGAAHAADAADSIDQSGTDIANALDRASRSFAPGHLKRIVLLSDGNGNAGDLAATVSRLRQEKTRVFTLPLAARANGDVWIEGILTPGTVTADEQFPVEVQVYSQTSMKADLELKGGSKALAKRAVQLNPGLNRLAFETRVSKTSGGAVLEAVVTPAEDVFAENNTYREPVAVVARPRILYVESRAASARYLRDALTIEGMQVDVVDPPRMPASAAAFEPYDAVVLSDVDGKTLSNAQMLALAAYVRDSGGGLLMAGGENIYGEGGYSLTPIEEVLPVTFDVSRKKPPTVAMVVVMDNSGSMSGQKMALAKEAAKAPLELLRDSDSFGAMSFNTGYTWVVNLAPVTNRPAIANAIASVGVQGGTDAYPAMEEAYKAMAGSKNEIKAILFLTDGRTQLRDYKTLTTKMFAAGIHVSTVAIGAGADRELLADISMWGKGRAYYLENPSNVQQIFVRETELAMDKALHEAPFNLLVRKSVDAFKGVDFPGAPNLLGYVSTKPKPTSEILLAESIAGDPILSRWQFGLGKAAMFASDLKDRWAANWLQWDEYPKFWSQLVRETMRRKDEDFALQASRSATRASLTIDAVGKDGRFRNALRVQARGFDGNGASSTINMEQVGPGAYEGGLKVSGKGTYQFQAGEDSERGPSRTLTYSFPDEYRFHPTDTSTLRDISQETGGQFQPLAQDIMNPHGETIDVPLPLWRWLTLLALAAFVADVLLRRLRLFEPI